MAKRITDLTQTFALTKADDWHVAQIAGDRKASLDVLAAHIIQESDYGFVSETLLVDTVVSSLLHQRKSYLINTSAGNIQLSLPLTGGSAVDGGIVLAVNIGTANTATVVYRSMTSITLPIGGYAVFVWDGTYWILTHNSVYLNGKTVGNASGNIPVSNGTLNVNLNADLFDDLNSDAFAQLAAANTFTNTNQFTGTTQIAGASQFTTALPTGPAGGDLLAKGSNVFRGIQNGATGASIFGGYTWTRVTTGQYTILKSTLGIPTTDNNCSIVANPDLGSGYIDVIAVVNQTATYIEVRIFNLGLSSYVDALFNWMVML